MDMDLDFNLMDLRIWISSDGFEDLDFQVMDLRIWIFK
jgi:hypothetical protein